MCRSGGLSWNKNADWLVEWNFLAFVSISPAAAAKLLQRMNISSTKDTSCFDFAVSSSHLPRHSSHAGWNANPNSYTTIVQRQLHCTEVHDDADDSAESPSEDSGKAILPFLSYFRSFVHWYLHSFKLMAFFHHLLDLCFVSFFLFFSWAKVVAVTG